MSGTRYRWPLSPTPVVIISCFDFITLLQGGYIGGEAIWAHSSSLPQKSDIAVLDVSHLAQYQALKNMGDSVLFVLNMEFAVHLYHIFGSLVSSKSSSPRLISPNTASVH
jgi:hypothetical protein